MIKLQKIPDQYAKGLRDHWLQQRKDPTYEGRRATAVNDCWRPSNEATKADLAEFHAENMGIRRRKQLARERNVRFRPSTSIAEGSHKHERERARHLRQMGL